MAEGYGAHLIKKPELVKDMVRQTQSRICQPDFSISIKIRLHKDIRETVDLCQKAEHAGISWVTVHGRTVQQRTEPVDYAAIKTINDSVLIPVVANGDIKYLEDVDKLHKNTGVKGVMAARGMLQNPAMYAGYENTPLQCVQDWVDIAVGLGTPFPCFHYHLIAMMERVTSKPEKKIFNTLHSTPAVLDYLKEHYDVQYNGQQQAKLTDRLDALHLKPSPLGSNIDS
ncbi:tRNA-dihydrouridine(20a/20b) synthase [NAD(P)+]-like [Anneissia japonica]|uniref:tRNA-dihydrouridine(20a/20b) synthase [NAD(P)+]-like n=1 Tax=Anneissia japonica TaxID=1529436 RepID=UPI00142570F1|nr:tRNA-dihydrouridine(20a/20b) synthase [NAD(P)+]-like [Anneissia japonica]